MGRRKKFLWLFVVALALGAVAWNINAANAGDGGVAGGGSSGPYLVCQQPGAGPYSILSLMPLTLPAHPSGNLSTNFRA